VTVHVPPVLPAGAPTLSPADTLMNARTLLTLAVLSAAALPSSRPAAAQTGNASTTPSVTLPAPPPRHSRDRNLISGEEVETSTTSNALQLVQALHPQWLRGHGQDSFQRPTSVVVYQDGMRMGGADVLRNISRQSVAEIRYLNGIEAGQRWGMDHGSGAILVTTR
jgi:hypothetical protein